VFLGERDDQQVIGLHNWMQLWNEERNGRLNYTGNIRSAADQFITIQFQWDGLQKNMSSLLVGTSPEYDMALATLCFFNGLPETNVQAGPHRLKMKAYPITQGGAKYIGTVYFE
jgi:poly(U)-specific endoribonuclease